MKRALLMLLFLLLFTACAAKKEGPQESILDKLNEPIDFSRVKDLDFAQALDMIEAETEKVYLPAFDDMYQAVREYKFNIQDERAYIQSSYEFDENDSEFSNEVSAYYGKEEKEPIIDRGKEYLWHLIKKSLGKSERINQAGYKGYYTLYGAKLDDRQFYMTKDGYTYRVSSLRRTPKGFEDFNFVQYTIDSMHIADDYGEWDELKVDFIPNIKLPNVSGYQAKLLSFNVNYHEGKRAANEFKYVFRNEETTFYFGVFEDGYEFDMLAYDTGINARNTSEKATRLQLANGQELSRHQFERLYKIKRVIYSWKMDGLHYYLTVEDDRIQYEEELEAYEEEFIQLIESVGKP